MKREQHWEALAKANEVRLARTEVKREIGGIEDRRESLYALADVLDTSDPDSDGYAWWMHTLHAGKFLTWANGVGSQKSNAILLNACVNPQRELGDLTNRERTSLARAMIDAAKKLERRKNPNETWARQVLEEVA